MMREYNGFSGDERAQGAAYHRRMRAQGLWSLPTRCSACGQTEGVIDAHWEDYSKPFDTERDIPLCFRCHMMVHMRDRNPRGWDRYRALVRSGYRGEPLFQRSIGAVIRDHMGPIVDDDLNEPAGGEKGLHATILDVIHYGAVHRRGRGVAPPS